LINPEGDLLEQTMLDERYIDVQESNIIDNLFNFDQFYIQTVFDKFIYLPRKRVVNIDNLISDLQERNDLEWKKENSIFKSFLDDSQNLFKQCLI